MRNLVHKVGARYRLVLFAVLLAALVGTYAAVAAPATRAQIIGSGGCTYYVSHNELWDNSDKTYLYHTNLCVFGPFYDSSGKYYTFDGSCWLSSAQLLQQSNSNYKYMDFLYRLGCTQDDNVTVYNWTSTWAAYCSSCTPAVARSITFSSVRVPAGRTVRIYTNGYSGIYLADDPGSLGSLLFPNPSDSTMSRQYLP